MKRIVVSGETFECAAKPSPWRFGLRVEIDTMRSGKRAGRVHVVCASNRAEFDNLSSLAPSDLCDVALSRFVAGDLSVTPERILLWQAEIGKLGFDYLSPLATSFQRT